MTESICSLGLHASQKGAPEKSTPAHSSKVLSKNREIFTCSSEMRRSRRLPKSPKKGRRRGTTKSRRRSGSMLRTSPRTGSILRLSQVYFALKRLQRPASVLLCTTVASLHEHVLYENTSDLSTESLGPIALFSVQVSFVISTLVDLVRRLI